MAEPERIDALARTATPGRLGADGDPGVCLARRTGLSLVQVTAFPDGASATASTLAAALGMARPPEPNRAAAAQGGACLWTGPERWLLVVSDRAEGALAAELAAALDPGQASVVDLSHARVAIRLAGPRAREVIAKGCSLDVDPAAFPPGACAQSTLHHVAALIHAVDAAPTFDVFAARSYAVSLWEMLVDAALEYGCEVDA